MTQSALHRLARYCGILPEYWQVDGTHCVCAPETVSALLTAMGIKASTDVEATETLAGYEARDSDRPFPRDILLTAETASEYPLPAWTITLENGGHLKCDPAAPGQIPALPSGVHTLSAAGHYARVIASPAQAPSVSQITGVDRVWGIWTSLYGQRSTRNTGLGDYEDLARLAEALAPSGATFVGINPVHARDGNSTDISPYSPSSRTALDTGHIALDCIPEIDNCPRARARIEAASDLLMRGRAAPMVAHDVHDAIADDILRALFETFEMNGSEVRRQAFATWQRSRDPDEARQSVFATISARHGPDWREWPTALQDPDSQDVRSFAAQNIPEIRYHDWQQWIASTQIADAQRRARRAGMPLGLYLDIAVGVRPGSAET